MYFLYNSLLLLYLRPFCKKGKNRYKELAMKVLLDTNIIIHREANRVINSDIGVLFNWLDRLHHTKCIHPITIKEIEKNSNQSTVDTFTVKIENYIRLKTEAPINDTIRTVCEPLDLNDNDKNDTKLLNELFCGRVDILITEDKKIHRKAELLGISESVFTIESYLEKVAAENPELVDYKVLSVKKELFGNINLRDNFFDSFKEDYKGFDVWFNQKAEEVAYICQNNDALSAFLFIKIENEAENYSNISPIFAKKKRLKIGTFKVVSNGVRLGERFLKIVFDNARANKSDEIYVTIFDKRPEQQRLIELLEEWGFVYHGIKSSSSGEEKVYVRDFSIHSNPEHPKLTFPWLSKSNKVFIVPIYPEYHTELFPDSKLNTESADDFIVNEPHRNSISKVYISHSQERNLAPGDTILFYRTGDTSPKIYSSVITTIGIVENAIDNIKDENELIALCRKKTVLNDVELKKFWNRYSGYKPFIVNFLYAFSFKKRPTLKQLNELGIIPDIKDVPRGFREIKLEQLEELIKKYGI
jgi:hypothetical protein